MEFFDSLVLGAVQGVSEFLPISSSGHLVLVEHWLGLDAKNLVSFDIIVHFATLCAIAVYFRKEIFVLFSSFVSFLRGKKNFSDPGVMMIVYIIVGTVPAVFAGVFLKDFIVSEMRDIRVVGGAMFVVAIVFIVAEVFYKRKRKDFSVLENCAEKKDELLSSIRIRHLTIKSVVLIGVAQAFALIPGISRSGFTISAGLLSGIKREAAARFSFLLGMPVIFGAFILELFEAGEPNVAMGQLILGFLSAFAFGLLSIYFLMRFLKNHSLIVFSVYLIALSLFIFS